MNKTASITISRSMRTSSGQIVIGLLALSIEAQYVNAVATTTILAMGNAPKIPGNNSFGRPVKRNVKRYKPANASELPHSIAALGPRGSCREIPHSVVASRLNKIPSLFSVDDLMALVIEESHSRITEGFVR